MKQTLAAVSLTLAVLIALITSTPSHPSAATLDSCPISLTNPDGQSMALVKYDLRAAVHGALALVEMEMTFRNAENRQLEGRFTYTLPPGATISRFAKEVNGKLMEGEVVERMRAQAIYTQLLHTMRDPALLETDQGNRFSARVFPVPAHGTVRLLLAFSQQLPIKEGVRKLTIPLAGLPKIGEFTFNAIGHPLESETGTGIVLDKEEPLGDDLSAVARHATDYTPTKDIELTFKAAAILPSPAGGAAVHPSPLGGEGPGVRGNGAGTRFHVLKAGHFQMVQFLYNPPGAQTIAPPTDWSFYFDTSASGADTEAPRLQVIERLLSGLVPVLREKDNLLSVTAFDIDMAELLKDVSMNTEGGKPIVPEIIHDLRARHALGATNLEAALKSIGEKARANKNACTFVLVSGGIATWGKREMKDLLAALGDWPAQDTLHALVIGNKQDDKTLNAIVEKTHGRVVVLPLTTDVEGNVTKAIAEMRAPLGAHFDVYDEGTAWIYPKSFHDVRPGQEMIAFSEIKEGGKSLPGFVQVGADGKTIKDTQVTIVPTEVADFAPLLQRETYKAYLDFLEKQEQSEKDAMKRTELHQKRIEISVKNRVMCPLTSLLVLETENDYARFGINRTALADVMVVGKSGIELRKRSPDEVPMAPEKAGATLFKKPAEGDVQQRLAKAEDSLRKKLDDKDEPVIRRVESIDELRSEGEVQEQEGLKQAASIDGTLYSGFAAASPDFPGPRIDPPGAAPTPALSVRTGRGGQVPNQDGAARQNAQPAVPEGFVRAREAATRAPGTNLALIAPVDWTAQADELPTDAQLNELRAKIQTDPRDRKLRNAYADALLKAKKFDNLQAEVFQWLPFDPENPAVYEYLGKSAAGLNDPKLALRAYSSIAEIAPNRAALLARAGFLLLAAKKYDLAESMFREALKNRQDDCNLYRGLSLSLFLAGDYDGASVAIETALMRDFDARYGDTKRVLREEFGYVLRAWRKKDPSKTDAIVARAQRANVDLLRTDALRVTMCWETDANDVDLHIVDPNNEECFYQHKNNASGLELYSDQTQGLGPEVIRTEKAIAGTYHIGVNYFSAGPMGVSRGVVVIMKPVEGVDENPRVIPFALIEGGSDMRHVGTVSY